MRVEYRGSTAEGYGKGRERNMTFGGFLRAITGTGGSSGSDSCGGDRSRSCGGGGGGISGDGESGRKDDGASAPSSLLYLTTQDLGTDDDGRPNIMAAPTTCLQGDFPLRPNLMGNLVPFNINVWMGHSEEGSSSYVTESIKWHKTPSHC